MTVFWSNIVYLVVGFILGIVGSIFVEWRKRSWEEHDQKEYGKKMLQALCQEIEEGITRCKMLIELAGKEKISFSRIYTALWDSMRSKIPQYIEDVETLRLLHKIYYRFDLINFNMEREEFGVGAAFAKSHYGEIETNYNSLKGKIDP